MWNSYLKRLVVFVIIFSFLSFPLYSSKSFETKQSVFYNWSIDVTDLDQSCSIPYERYSFHQLIKSETHEGCIYLARGSETPSQLVCISSNDGSVLWDYTKEKKLNIDVPFLITENSILVNYTNEIHVISKEDSTLYRILDSTVLPENSHSIFKNDEYIITEVKSNSINCFNSLDTTLQWTYEFPSNCTYRILGVFDETLFMLEQTKDSTQLKGIPISSGVEKQIVSWDNTLLRVDAVVTNKNIELGVLHKDGSFSITNVEKEAIDEYKTTEIVVKEKASSLEILKNANPSLVLETNLLGFRFLTNQDNYYLVNSTQTSDKNGHSVLLNAICCDNNGSTIWNQQYESVESTDSIVDDLFIQDDFIVFQFSYREPLTMKIMQSFWLNLETGAIEQTFYDNVSYWNEVSDQGLRFCPHTIIFTSTPESKYLCSIVGYSFVNSGFYKEEIKKVNLQNVEVQEIWKKSFKNDNWSFSIYSPFEYDHCICFFAWYRNTDLNRWENALFKYNMVTKTELPPVLFKDFLGFYKGDMLLRGDLLTVPGSSRDRKTYLVCYNLKTGETVWKKEAQVICNIGENFLTVKNTKKHSQFYFISGIDGNEIWNYSFSNQASFCGIDKNNHAYFERNSAVISQLNLEDGALEDEILLSYPHGSNVCIKDNYMIFQMGYNAFQCLFIPTKKVLWTKNLEQYSNYFLKKGSYSSRWIGKTINEDEMLSFYENNLMVFNLRTGVPSICYDLEPYKIDSIEKLQDNTFFIDTDESENNAKIISFDVNKPNNGTAYIFPEKENEYDDDYIMGHFKYKNEIFFMQRLPKGIFRIGSAVSTTIKKHIEPTNIKPECTNFLYYEDYIIFQASLGTKNSNFYLLAFNTLDGTITKIHKGMHEKFFIYKQMLYFVQYGYYYSCIFGEFQPKRTNYSFDDPQFVSDGGELDLKNYQENVPEEYKVLDLFYINQVLTGSFSQPLIDETLFLTGDFNYSKIGIIEKQSKLFAPFIHGGLELEHGEYSGETYYAFWQSMIADIDNDDLDEIINVNYSKNSSEIVVYIWEYSQETEEMVSHEILNRKNISMPELIKKNDKIYLQYSYYHDYSWKLKQRELKYNPDKSKIFSLNYCKEELTTELYKKPETPRLSKFQFLETPVNDEPCLEIVETKESDGFPLVKMPDKYYDVDNKLTKKELEYVQKRNTHIDELIDLLNKGVDPFEGILVNRYGFDDTSTYKVSLRIDEEIDYQSDTIPITSIDTLIPIKEKETKYIVIRAVDIWDGRHIFLFSDQFEFLDVISHGGNDAEYNAETIVSLKHPNHFWFNTSMWRGPYRLCFMCVNNSKLNCTMRLGCPSLIKKEDETFILMEDSYLYVEGSRHSSIYAYEYIDPWSGQPVSQLFLDEMKMQLDYLYSCYQYYHSFTLIPGRISGAGGNTIKLEDGRTKYLNTSSSVYILEVYESIFYRYGWK